MEFHDNTALTGFGAHTAQEVNELQKALSVGSEYATQTPGNLTGGAALAVEDLDRTLKLVTFGVEHFRLWRDILKERTTQTVHEFNIQNSYGKEVSPFFQMGSVPQQTDASYNRDLAIVKYLGTYGQVQHNLTLIQAAHGPVVAREVKNKTIELLERNEMAMFNADSSINALEYDGINSQIRSKQGLAKYTAQAFVGYDSSNVSGSSVILDQRGALPDEDLWENGCLIALNNFGMPMDCYLSTDIHSRFSRSFYDKERTRPGDATPAGYLIPAFKGSLNFRFKGNVFNRPRRFPLAQTISAAAAPTLGTLTQASSASSQFAAADAGSYSYIVSAVYADGETLPSSAQTISVTTGNGVSAPLTYTGAPLYFNVFRSALGGSSGWEFIQRVAPPTGGSTNSQLLDLNVYLPGLGQAYLLMHDPDVLVWRQLGSMIKYDLAVIDTSYRWLQLLYGMVVIPAIRKNVIFANIGVQA